MKRQAKILAFSLSLLKILCFHFFWCCCLWLVNYRFLFWDCFSLLNQKVWLETSKRVLICIPCGIKEVLKIYLSVLQHQGIVSLFCWAKYPESGISLWFPLLCFVFNVCSMPSLPRFDCLVSNFVSGPFWFLWLEKLSWN